MKQSILIFIAALFLTSCAHQPSIHYDIIIKGGSIIDGTGAAAYQSDLAINDDSIVAIGNLGNASADAIVNASGKIVSPGFIDLHSHDERNVIRRPDALNNIRQGVTTILGGNCGGSPIDLEDYFTKVKEQGTALNVGILVGHNSVRRKIMNRDNRLATDTEMELMKALVDNAMQAGAFGMSSGLSYIPGAFSPPEEIAELAKVVHEYNGFYASHMRSESSNVVESVAETIQVGIETGIPVHISHHKTSGPMAWGLSKNTLALIDKHLANGLDVSLDQYTYTASNTNMGVLLPNWSLAGGKKAFAKRIEDPETKANIIKQSANIIKTERAGTELWRIQISEYAKDTSLEGKNFQQILEQRGLEQTLDNAAELAIELYLNSGRGIYHTMKDDDVERIMRHPKTSIASDGRSTEWQKGSPHPRNYGTYPRAIATYVRDKKVLTVEQAINKMTAMPATRMGLKDRGVIAVGNKADILVWDFSKIQDHSTFAEPHQYSTGMEYIFINGVAVVSASKSTGMRPGLLLKNAP